MLRTLLSTSPLISCRENGDHPSLSFSPKPAKPVSSACLVTPSSSFINFVALLYMCSGILTFFFNMEPRTAHNVQGEAGPTLRRIFQNRFLPFCICPVISMFCQRWIPYICLQFAWLSPLCWFIEILNVLWIKIQWILWDYIHTHSNSSRLAWFIFWYYIKCQFFFQLLLLNLFSCWYYIWCDTHETLVVSVFLRLMQPPSLDRDRLRHRERTSKT